MRLYPQFLWLLLLLLFTSCRSSWQQREKVIAALQLQSGDRVADLGAGEGYFTFHLADAVGPSGKVFALEVDPELARALREVVKERRYRNIEVLLIPPDDPSLASRSVDLLFVCNTYHHIERRPEYFAKARGALAEGGRVAILELRDGGGLHGLFFGSHSTSATVIRTEMKGAGYSQRQSHSFLERQEFLIFSAP